MTRLCDLDILDKHSSLELSQIRRLLGPLRRRCRSLNEFIAGYWEKASDPDHMSIRKLRRVQKFGVTYGSKAHIQAGNRGRGQSLGPLYSFSPSFRLISATSGASRETFQGIPVAGLIKEVYLVRGAFISVLESARPERERASEHALPRLVDLAAQVLGQEIEREVSRFLAQSNGRQVPHRQSDELNDLSSDDEKDEEEDAVLDQLYEEIPSHMRRGCLVSQAIDIILSTVRHPVAGLIESLLVECIMFRADSDVKYLLSHLLAIAFIPCPELPINMPCHAGYLEQLYCKGVRPDGSRCWSNFEFSNILLKAVQSTTDSLADRILLTSGPFHVAVCDIGGACLLDTLRAILERLEIGPSKDIQPQCSPVSKVIETLVRGFTKDHQFYTDHPYTVRRMGPALAETAILLAQVARQTYMKDNNAFQVAVFAMLVHAVYRMDRAECGYYDDLIAEIRSFDNRLPMSSAVLLFDSDPPLEILLDYAETFRKLGLPQIEAAFLKAIAAVPEEEMSDLIEDMLKDAERRCVLEDNENQWEYEEMVDAWVKVPVQREGREYGIRGLRNRHVVERSAAQKDMQFNSSQIPLIKTSPATSPDPSSSQDSPTEDEGVPSGIHRDSAVSKKRQLVDRETMERTAKKVRSNPKQLPAATPCAPLDPLELSSDDLNLFRIPSPPRRSRAPTSKRLNTSKSTTLGRA